jgi:hypothetical protein
VGVTEDDTDLGGGGTTLGEAADLLNDLVGSGLQPRRGSAAVGGSRRADTLSLAVKTTHGCGVLVFDGGGVGRRLSKVGWSKWSSDQRDVIEVSRVAKKIGSKAPGKLCARQDLEN